jgi:hypothetical protein
VKHLQTALPSIVIGSALVAGCLLLLAAFTEAPAPTVRTVQVQGTATHFFSTAVRHSSQPTATGEIVRTTDIIRLEGDIDGYALYHPTTVIDGAAGTLVNTGTQIFSGTVAGSGPVLLHDDRFRFEVNLQTGETVGEIYLGKSADAPAGEGWFECRLTAVGTGMTPEGDGLAEYTGSCTEHAPSGS